MRAHLLTEFTVWDDEDTEEDGITIAAYTPHEAAEEWAERYDSNSAEHSIVAGKREPAVHVRNQKNGLISNYVVSGESVPQYHARIA